jgi:arylsulfatase A-like enzyme
MEITRMMASPTRPMSEYNVLVVTLDSCRFDSVARARTPFLDTLGPLRRALTPGTFTLPAHAAFFSGYLPNVTELPHQDYYSREKKQLWRLSRAKHKPADTYELLLQGDSIIDGFRNAGYHTLGAGGVRWFLTQQLTHQFHEFHFWGPRDYKEWFITRTHDDFALNHADELVARLKPHQRWFAFINALETHAPYNNGADPVDEQVTRIIADAEPIWAGRRAKALDVAIPPQDFHTLHRAQIRAVEVVDQRLHRLVTALPGPTAVVVCGDHGESFGEDGRWGHGFPTEPVMNVPLIIGFTD